jgi:solute:Na+ symporter, SSS family
VHITPLDWTIVAISIVISFVPAIFFFKRASSSTVEFFTSGRAAPWWLIGLSMVATTFSTDTPNLVTNMVREKGVADNWLWWSFLLTGMLTVFFYARMWRRSRVLTDLEFYEIRYAGKAAAFLRGFRSLYLGFFFNCIIMASVNLAAAKIANIVLGWPMAQTLTIAGIITVFFASVSGLWGVLVTDSLQFTITMSGAFVVAYFALKQPQVGGLSGLFHQMTPTTLNLVPDFHNWGLTLSAFIIPLTVQWWSVWYPGAEPGGGSYVAQRMLAAKSERDALAGTLLFNVMHYALRPWPWIIVALSSIIMFPHLSDISQAFPYVDKKLIGDDMAYPAMLKFLPAGALGFLMAGLLAAYRSTIETHLNWGTSYIVHDFYRRFLNRGAPERHYVLMGRIVTALLMISAGSFTFVLDTARTTFDLLLSVGAGTGLIYLLRWFWWRINAWSEISAMLSSLLVAVSFYVANRMGHPVPEYASLIGTVAITTVVWVLVTFLTEPTEHSTLLSFYRLVRPAGPGWKKVREEVGGEPSPDNLPNSLLAWVLGCAMVYSALFGVGSLLYGAAAQGYTLIAVCLLSAIALARLIPNLWPHQVMHD